MLMILHPMSISQFLRLLLLIYSLYKIVGKRALSTRQHRPDTVTCALAMSHYPGSQRARPNGHQISLQRESCCNSTSWVLREFPA